MEEKELQELIRLKRYEQPEEGYFDDFLTEFQQRQRAELLQTSARGLLVERVKAWCNISSLSNKWLIGSGLACAAAIAVAFTMHYLPKVQHQQLVEQQLDKLPTDVAETRADVILKSISASNQVSNEVIQEQMQPIDFSQPLTEQDPVFTTEPTFF